jgi:hypothetical protein
MEQIENITDRFRSVDVLANRVGDKTNKHCNLVEHLEPNNIQSVEEIQHPHLHEELTQSESQLGAP